MDISKYIRSIPDFPKPGIVFKDITPLLENPAAFGWAVDALCGKFRDCGAGKVCAPEARGFVFAAAMACKLGWGVVLVRKPGKLPWKTVSHSYALEYGTATLHIHEDAIEKGEKILLVDDLLATGGTSEAMIRLVERLGGEVAGLGFLMELDFLKGRDALKGYRVESLIHEAGE